MPPPDRSETVLVQKTEDVALVRQLLRQWLDELGFGSLDRTKVLTAASELTRNAITYGGGGTVQLETCADGTRRGIRITFEDHGPGIADIEQAMTNGFTTGGGLGLGLGGSRRLVNDFQIISKPGEGTRITVTQWL
jgi:serine/threonine-protein kinase RsbT